MNEPSSRPGGPGHSLPEGEERAPRGTRAMAGVRWALVAIAALAAAGAWIHHGTRPGPAAQAAEAARYSCPMHPAVISSGPGQCSICGMDLVPVEAGRPDAAAAAGAVPSPRYSCPMHPGFLTDDPDAHCPECGMRAVPRAQAAPGAAPGPGEVVIAEDRIQLMGLRTTPAVREPLPRAIRTVGFVTADEAGLVSVSARFSGWIESLGALRTGQQVEKGAVLATIYAPETLSAQQVFLSAVRWSDRPDGALQRDARQKLLLLGIASQDIDGMARTGQARTAVPVRAPAGGYVARKAVVRGAYVQAGTELFTIVDLSTVWVLVDVSEDEVALVSAGQPSSFEVSAWPGESFRGKIDFVYPAMNPGSRTLQARIALPNPGLRLRPGMFGDVTLEARPEEALVVPRDALVDTGDAQYVFVARAPGRFAARRVRAGWSGAEKVVIREGLAEGEQVVIAATFLLDSESRLRSALDAAGATAPGAPAEEVPAAAAPPSP